MTVLTVVIYGPMACGKTRNAEALRKAYNCKGIIDSWSDGKKHKNVRLTENYLHLTYEEPNHIIKCMHGEAAVIVPFSTAMKRLSK